MVERESRLLKVALWPLHMCLGTFMLAFTNTYITIKSPPVFTWAASSGALLFGLLFLLLKCTWIIVMIRSLSICQLKTLKSSCRSLKRKHKTGSQLWVTLRILKSSNRKSLLTLIFLPKWPRPRNQRAITLHGWLGPIMWICQGDEALPSSYCSLGRSKYDMKQKPEGNEYNSRNCEKITNILISIMLNYKATDERDYIIL